MEEGVHKTKVLSSICLTCPSYILWHDLAKADASRVAEARTVVRPVPYVHAHDVDFSLGPER